MKTLTTLALTTALIAGTASATLTPANTDDELKFLFPSNWRDKMVERVNVAPLGLLCKGELLKAHFPLIAAASIKDYKFQSILAKQRIAEESINCFGDNVTPLGQTAPGLCAAIDKKKEAMTAAIIGSLFQIYDNSRNSARFGYSDASGTTGTGVAALMGANSYAGWTEKQESIKCSGYEAKKKTNTKVESTSNNWSAVDEDEEVVPEFDPEVFINFFN